MDPVTTARALECAIRRNSAAAALYRTLAHRSTERWLSGLAATWREQRDNLAPELSAIAAALPAAATELPVFSPPELSSADVPDATNPKAALEAIRKIEADDLALFEALIEASTDDAWSRRLASVAEGIRLRLGVADDHLDLLSLS